MDDRPLRTLPEELMLVCADPGTGAIKRPEFFKRALAGAVLAELELQGAILIEDGRIVGLRPVQLDDPFVGGMFDKLAGDIRRGRPDADQTRLASPPESLSQLRHDLPDGLVARVSAAARSGIAAHMTKWPLHGWISTWRHFQDVERRCLDAMEARGLLIARRRRVLGIIPHVSWRAPSPSAAKESVARVDEAVRAVTVGGFGPPSRRTEYLVALFGAAGLSTRLYPGRQHRDIRTRIEQVTSSLPIAAAAEYIRQADWKHRMSNSD
ncbi:GPP34 family phosphoprotein [Streptomyces sp. NPDC005078]|uniref:GOLPH3/VPS74 family protein n=1 Tax=unclassified Streptomyces TaxID=2593676 RepID=UPI0033BC8145